MPCPLSPSTPNADPVPLALNYNVADRLQAVQAAAAAAAVSAAGSLTTATRAAVAAAPVRLRSGRGPCTRGSKVAAATIAAAVAMPLPRMRGPLCVVLFQLR